MTMIVKRDGQPDRLACEYCRCEIGFGAGDPLPKRARTEQQQYDEGSPGHPTTPLAEMDAEEPPIRFEQSCPCRCHDNWRIMHGHALPEGAEVAA